MTFIIHLRPDPVDVFRRCDHETMTNAWRSFAEIKRDTGRHVAHPLAWKVQISLSIPGKYWSTCGLSLPAWQVRRVGKQGVRESRYPILQEYSKTVPWIAPLEVSHPSILSKSVLAIWAGEGHMTSSKGSWKVFCSSLMHTFWQNKKEDTV